MMKLFLFGLVLFSTLGISIAREILAVFRLDSNYMAVGAVSLVLTCLLVNLIRNGKFLFLVVAALALSINLPEEVLAEHGMDREVLISALLAMVLFPFFHRMKIN